MLFAPRHFFSSLDPRNLIFNPGYDWIKIEIISESGAIDHETTTDDAGDHYSISISGSLPKERPEVSNILKKYKGLPCIISLQDQNGYNRLTGHTPGEMFISYNSTSGDKAASENGYKISFKGKQLEEALFLSQNL